MASDLQHDLISWLVSVCIAGALLKAHTIAADLKVLPQTRVRKGLHITTGIVYVATWSLYSSAPHARYLAVLTPVAHTLRTLAVYLGIAQAPDLLAIMTRTGKREELSNGPVWYGLVLIAVTLIGWRRHPAAVAAVCVMCAGDGFAEVAGQRLRGPRWPFNRSKTVAGSCALVVAGWLAAFGLVQWFSAQGYFLYQTSPGHMAVVLAAATFLAALVEALPLGDVLNDNLTVPVVTALVVCLAAPTRLRQ